MSAEQLIPGVACAPTRGYRFAKRAFDVSVAAVALIVLPPLMLGLRSQSPLAPAARRCSASAASAASAASSGCGSSGRWCRTPSSSGRS